MSDTVCQYSYPGMGEFGAQQGNTVLRCEAPTYGRLFNWPVGAEDALQVRLCSLHADALGRALANQSSLSTSSRPEGDEW